MAVTVEGIETTIERISDAGDGPVVHRGRL
jgi:hypothetical protein